MTQAKFEVVCTPINETEKMAWHATPFLIDGFNAPMAYLRKVGKRFKHLGFVGPAGCVPEEHGFLPEMRAGLA